MITLTVVPPRPCPFDPPPLARALKASPKWFYPPLLHPHLLRLLASLFSFSSTFFSVISSRLGYCISHTEAWGPGEGGWRRDEEKRRRAVQGPLSSWNPKLYNQLLFCIHTDLRKCTVGISSYPGDLRERVQGREEQRETGEKGDPETKRGGLDGQRGGKMGTVSQRERQR